MTRRTLISIVSLAVLVAGLSAGLGLYLVARRL